MADYTDDTNTVRDDAGFQTAEIAVTNALIVGQRLLDECFKDGRYALAYALERQMGYLKAALGHIGVGTTTTIP